MSKLPAMKASDYPNRVIRALVSACDDYEVNLMSVSVGGVKCVYQLEGHEESWFIFSRMANEHELYTSIRDVISSRIGVGND